MSLLQEHSYLVPQSFLNVLFWLRYSFSVFVYNVILDMMKKLDQYLNLHNHENLKSHTL